ncbi:replication protein [Paenibacillus sp. Marseille-Q4541]|uniref:replication protein n=1 Tax=Paenibacillus sp. Marseille-Q4541 TaxID=2831522 RepID=UPI001BAD9AE0|nr:replication protein [Paenibacillus sp. Marseille-Q4541]
MASPQTQNGYTSIANEILEQIARRRFNGVQRSIIDVIWRYTYGFRRKEHQLANGFIAEAIDADLKGVKVELTRLIEWNVITVTKEGAGSRPRTLSFNKNYDQWIVGGKSEPKKIKNSGGIEDSSALEEDDSPPINKEGDAKVMAPKGKLEKSRIGKQEYAESVWLKPEEHEKLLSEFGQEGVTWMIDVLSSYKLSVDKFYASDYAVFKRGGWLRQKYEKYISISEMNKNGGYKNRSQQAHDDLDDLKNLYLNEVNGDGNNHNGSDSRIVSEDQKGLPEFRQYR